MSRFKIVLCEETEYFEGLNKLKETLKPKVNRNKWLSYSLESLFIGETKLYKLSFGWNRSSEPSYVLVEPSQDKKSAKLLALYVVKPVKEMLKGRIIMDTLFLLGKCGYSYIFLDAVVNDKAAFKFMHAFEFQPVGEFVDGDYRKNIVAAYDCKKSSKFNKMRRDARKIYGDFKEKKYDMDRLIAN